MFVEIKEDIFELVYFCIGKQQGWIVVWYQGVVGNYLMFFVMEKVEKCLMDFSGVFVYNYFEIKLYVIF